MRCETIPATIIGPRKIFADHYVCRLVTNQCRSGYLAVRYLKMFNNELVLFGEAQVAPQHFYQVRGSHRRPNGHEKYFL